MSTKKNSAKKAAQKPKKTQASLSKKDEMLLEQSLKMVSDLNKKISQVQSDKKKLESNVSDLGKRVSVTENKPVPKAPSTSKIKDEILREFEPLMKNVNPKDLRKKITKELSKTLDIEVNKLRSDLSNDLSTSKKRFALAFTDLERRVMLSLKDNEGVHQEISRIKGIRKDDIIAEVKKNLEKSLGTISYKLSAVQSHSKKELDNLRNQIDKFKSQSSNLEKSQQKLKLDLEAISRRDVTHKELESKLKKLENENQLIRSSLEKYEQAVFNMKKDEEKRIEKKIEDLLNEVDSNLSKNKKEEFAQAQFMIEKINEVIDNVNQFEDYLEEVEKKSVSTVRQSIKETLKRDRKKFENDLDLKYKADTLKNRDEIKRAIAAVNDKNQDIEKSVNDFKASIQETMKEYVANIEKELSNIIGKSEALDMKKKEFIKELEDSVAADIKAIDEKFQALFGASDSQLQELIKEKKAEEQAVSKSIDEIKAGFQALSKENKAYVLESRKELENEVKDFIKKESQVAKEEIAKQVLSNKDYLTRLATENKENQRMIAENVENKLLAATTQFNDDYEKHLAMFDQELKMKEDAFVVKLSGIHEEKEIIVKELGQFRHEVAELTKEYVKNLDEEYQKIKQEEENFEKEKQTFVLEIDDLTKLRKSELDNFADEMKASVGSVIEEQQKTFNRHEETFRDLFAEKVDNLHGYQKKRLDSIEKKFVEKNLKYVRDAVDEEIKVVKLVEENLNAKAEETLAKLAEIEGKETTFYEDAMGYEKRIGEKVEERLVQLEQQLNKRFLDMDSDFTNFKGTVVDEVEDLMKHVETLMNEKVESVDQNLTKIKFAGNETVKRVQEFDTMKKEFVENFTAMKNEINDLRVHVEIKNGGNSLNNLVNQMSEYEEGLISLIQSLQHRGVSEDEIRIALQNKGHPMFYVNMVLNQLTQNNYN